MPSALMNNPSSAIFIALSKDKPSEGSAEEAALLALLRRLQALMAEISAPSKVGGGPPQRAFFQPMTWLVFHRVPS